MQESSSVREERGGGGGEGGARVIPSSRRPDGSMRKEIRVRAGYVPQDEVAKYEARGSRPKSSGPSLPPGVDPAYAAELAAARAKAAKKKGKKEKQVAKPMAADLDSVQERLQNLSTSTPISATSSAGKEYPSKDSVRTSSDSPERKEKGGSGTAPVDLEKKLRALRKKMRQAESLEAAVTSRGGNASAEEAEKISRLEDWRKEAEQLEKLIAG